MAETRWRVWLVLSMLMVAVSAGAQVTDCEEEPDGGSVGSAARDRILPKRYLIRQRNRALPAPQSTDQNQGIN